VIIAGLTGGIGHGKTTFARLLAHHSRNARHFETWELVAEVATALRSQQLNHPAPDNITAVNEWLYPLIDALAMYMHASITFADFKITPARLERHPERFEKLFEYLRLIERQPELADIDINDDTKDIFRPLLQWLGGYMVIKAGSGVWYNEILRRIAHLQSTGFDLVTVGGVRYPADAERLRNAGGVIICIDRIGQPKRDTKDMTERERSLIEPDCLVRNNDSLRQLAVCANLVYHDLRLHQLQHEYQSQTVTTPKSISTK
jgi:hypothetical protein